MQVLASDHRRPFPGEQRGELAGNVVLFRSLNFPLPRGAAHLRRRYLLHHIQIAMRARESHQSPPGAVLGGLEQGATNFGLFQLRIARRHHRVDAEAVRVIRHRQEVQRPVDLHLGIQRLEVDGNATREPIGVVRRHVGITNAVGIQRIIAVQVQITPVQMTLLGIGTTGNTNGK